jgi:hypothetical protein
MQTLDEIALSLDPIPDKASNGHGYCEHYNQHFGLRRNDPLKLLEIGVWEGASLPLWAIYFPQAHITGADIDITRCQVVPERCRLWHCDQSSVPSLNNMANELGPWDIVIDDGSHDPRHQVLTFETLWPHLSPGGIYAVEDLHPNYTAFKDAKPRMIEFIGRTLQDDVHGRGKTGVARVENNPAEEVAKLAGREREIESMHIYRYLVVIQKR